ncbi:hypothetical protein [Acinetobacter pittii]|uniref:hypothetical protein n=1 Tax=Acinetobacter pittii TaxID=48296 RepID=UPI00202A9AEC|nr:hypothetical protein [Acinetobacter pittii]
MAKKFLNEKIKIIGFWTFGGIFWYLVIAFFLKSKYPIFDYNFNADQAYDVIKDALTLAAAFLAPVAAFVLFTDWREQHKEVALEKNTQETYKYLNDSFEAILEFKNEVCKGEKLNEDRCLGLVNKEDKIKYIIGFAERNLNLLDDIAITNQFKIDCKDIAEILKTCLSILYKLDYEYQISQLPYSPDFRIANVKIKEIEKKLTSLSKKLENFKV